MSKRLTDKHIHGKALLDKLDDKYFYNSSIVCLNTHTRFLDNTRIIYRHFKYYTTEIKKFQA